MNLLEVKNVVKIFRYGIFGFKFRAVDGVSLSLDKESPCIFTIAGESGSGKTTLGRIILGVLRPDDGEVLYNGMNIYNLKGEDLKRFRKEVQAVFQDPFSTFNPLRKPYEYLYETVKNFTELKDQIEINRYIDDTLSYLGLRLSDVRGKYLHEFSGGELQRVSIARALLTRPRLIIADEPVSMVDASIRVNILNLFKKIKEEFSTSFIYITHDISTAHYISDRIAIMYRGSFVEWGAIEKVISNPMHPYTQILIESIPEPDIGKRNQWIQPLKISGIEEKEFIAPGCKYASRCPFAMDKCIKQRPMAIEVEPEHYTMCWLYAK